MDEVEQMKTDGMDSPGKDESELKENNSPDYKGKDMNTLRNLNDMDVGDTKAVHITTLESDMNRPKQQHNSGVLHARDV
jgi:hypothetical protein